MRKIFAIGPVLALAATLGVAQQQKKAPLSPPANTSVTIAGKNISIQYSAPSMRGRKIFGELVPYGKVWRAGANAATTLKTDADLQFRNLSVPKGAYTLYVMPEADKWQLIINKQTGQWGTVYNQDQDLGRVNMDVAKLSSPVEKYTMTLSSTGGNQGQLKLEWADTSATVPFTVK